MKNIALVLALSVGSLVAQATSLRYEWPTPNGLAINNACYTETTFKSLAPVEYCSQTEVVAEKICYMTDSSEICSAYKGQPVRANEYVKEKTQCAKYVSNYMEVSRHVTVDKCVKYSEVRSEVDNLVCAEMGTSTTFAPTDYNVAVYQQYSGESAEQLLGHKHFSIPACQ